MSYHAYLALAAVAFVVISTASGNHPVVVEIEDLDVKTETETDRVAGYVISDHRNGGGNRQENLKFVLAIQSSGMWSEIKKRSVTVSTQPRLNDVLASTAGRSLQSLTDEELALLKRACHDGLKCVAVDQILVLKRVSEPLDNGGVSVRTAITKITKVLTDYTSEYDEQSYQYEEVTASDDPSKVYSSMTTIIEDNKELCQIDLDDSDEDYGTAKTGAATNAKNVVPTINNYNINNGTINSATVNLQPADSTKAVSDEAISSDKNANGKTITVKVVPETSNRAQTPNTARTSNRAQTPNGAQTSNRAQTPNGARQTDMPYTIDEALSADEDYSLSDEWSHYNGAPFYFDDIPDEDYNARPNNGTPDYGQYANDMPVNKGTVASKRMNVPETPANRNSVQLTESEMSDGPGVDIASSGSYNIQDVKKGSANQGTLNNGQMKTLNINKGTINNANIDKGNLGNGAITVGTVNNGPVNLGNVSSNTNNGSVTELDEYDLQQYVNSVENMYSSFLENIK